MSRACRTRSKIATPRSEHVPNQVALQALDDLRCRASLSNTALHIRARSRAVAQPDDQRHVQRAIGRAVSAVIEPVSCGAPGRRRYGCNGAYVGEGGFSATAVDVLAGRHQERGRVVRPEPNLLQRAWRDVGHDHIELCRQALRLILTLRDTLRDGSERKFNRIRRIREAREIGSQAARD